MARPTDFESPTGGSAGPAVGRYRGKDYRIDTGHGTPREGNTTVSRGTTSAPAGAEPAIWHPAELGRSGSDAGAASVCLVTLGLGGANISPSIVAQWECGTLLDCPNQGEDFVDVMVDGRTIARGIAMIWQDRLCIRVTQRFPERAPVQPTGAMT